MTQFKAPPRRVLIVDDNEDAANSLAMVLKLSGHETDSVYTATDALARVAAFRPDVVLLDIGLPGMDGYEVARLLREREASLGVTWRPSYWSRTAPSPTPSAHCPKK